MPSSYCHIWGIKLQLPHFKLRILYMFHKNLYAAHNLIWATDFAISRQQSFSSTTNCINFVRGSNHNKSFVSILTNLQTLIYVPGLWFTCCDSFTSTTKHANSVRRGLCNSWSSTSVLENVCHASFLCPHTEVSLRPY